MGVTWCVARTSGLRRHRSRLVEQDAQRANKGEQYAGVVDDVSGKDDVGSKVRSDGIVVTDTPARASGRARGAAVAMTSRVLATCPCT